MFVLEQLQELERQKNQFLSELNNAKNDLDDLTNPLNSLNTSIAYLETKTSQTAKNLLDSYRKELKEAKKHQKNILIKIHSLEEKLLDINTSISNLKIEPSDPINEQITRIVNAFFKHVEVNFQEIAKQFHQTYKVIVDANEFKCIYIRIIEDKNVAPWYQNEEIINSQEISSCLIEDYFKKIFSLFKTKLIEENPFKDTFNITFNDFKFSFFKEVYVTAKSSYFKFDDSDILFTIELL